MISKGYKKQLIVNAYNTQLLTNMDNVICNFIEDIKRLENFLLFRITDGIMLDYKLKNISIDYDIFQFLYYLITHIFSVYYYNGNENFESDVENSQEGILFYIRNALERKHMIDENPDYVKYLEDVYD